MADIAKNMLLDMEIAARKAESLLAKGNDMTAEDYTAAKSALAEVEGLKAKIELEKGRTEAKQMLDDQRAWLGSVGSTVGVAMLPAGNSEGHVSAKQASAAAAEEYADAFKSYLRSGVASKAMQEGLDEGGGFLVPEDIRQEIISKKPAPTLVYSRVSKSTTTRDMVTRSRVVYATDDIYTTGIRVTMTGEIPASSTAHRVTEPVWGQQRIQIFTGMMSMPITRNQLEDSWLEVQTFIARKFSETIDLFRDNMILNGTGIGQPTGFLQNPGATDKIGTVNSGAAATLTGDGLIDLEASVPPQYEDGFVWVMNKNSGYKTVRKLKDGAGRYLWAAGSQDDKLAVGSNGQLLGYPVLKSQFMPDVASGTYPVLGGNLQCYEWVDRVGLSIQVLQEVGAQDNQVILLARYRCGGDVLEPWMMKAQYVSA